jgi:carbamoyl-phosphate synthase large subunit
MVELATRAMLGEKIRDMGYGTGLYPPPPYFAVKVPVFSFEKLSDVDTHLGPEMKSTGEVLGIGRTMDEALYKGLIAAGYRMAHNGQENGGVLLTVRKSDQFEIVDVARGFCDLGFKLYATEGTAAVIRDFGMDVETVDKIHENPGDNVLTLLDTGKIDYVISTSARGRITSNDSVKLRRKAVERDIPCLTSLDTANAIIRSLMSRYSPASLELVDCNNLRREKRRLKFSKMESTGNDFIIFDAISQEIPNPEGLAVRLCNRRTGIGADSLVLITPPPAAMDGGDRASFAQQNSKHNFRTDAEIMPDAGMRFFNQDGSEGLMAGNAIRCVGKYLYDNNIRGIADRHDPQKTTAEIAIATASGIKKLLLYKQNGKVTSVRVDMGKPSFLPESIPALLPLARVPAGDLPDAPEEAVVNAPLTVEGTDYRVTALSVGTPHCVVFSGFVDKVDVARIGPKFENHPLFPDRVNTEFVRAASRNCLKMRVWERGNGETPACGTGACAAAIAAVLNGLCPQGENITVKVRGGDLIVNFTGATVYLTGQAALVYEGEIEV